MENLKDKPESGTNIQQLDDFLNNARDEIADDCRIPKHLLFYNPDYKHSDEHLKLPVGFVHDLEKITLKYSKRIKKIYFNLLKLKTKPRFKKRMMKGN